VLSSEETEALSLGLKFSFEPSKLNYLSHFLSFERFYRSLSYEQMHNKTNDLMNYLRSTLKQVAFSTFYSFTSCLSTHHKQFLRILKDLALDRKLIVTKPDKGNGVVLLDRDAYVEKMLLILQDTSKFTSCSEDWLTEVFRCEDKVNRFANSLYKDGIMNEHQKKLAYASGSKPGVMYGVPKVHKLGTPLRPILSTVGTYNYQLSKYLINLLSPLAGNVYSVKDSFTFASELGSLRNDNYFMASFDVESLFTNIPIAETIQIILSKVFPKDSDVFNGFNKKQFRKLLELCTRDNIFIFNDRMYKQIDGAPMGGCVSPTLADIFYLFMKLRG
jgi:hypothetical protein